MNDAIFRNLPECVVKFVKRAGNFKIKESYTNIFAKFDDDLNF